MLPPRLHCGGGRGNAQGICMAAAAGVVDDTAAAFMLLSKTMRFLTHVTACRVAIRSEKDLCRRLLPILAAPPVLRARRPSTRDVERGEEAAAAPPTPLAA